VQVSTASRRLMTFPQQRATREWSTHSSRLPVDCGEIGRGGAPHPGGDSLLTRASFNECQHPSRIPLRSRSRPMITTASAEVSGSPHLTTIDHPEVRGA
jgi:hypothetical protein